MAVQLYQSSTAIIDWFRRVIYNAIFPGDENVPVDLTQKPEMTGKRVVDTVVDRIKHSEIFKNDFGYIKRIAWVETKFGQDPAQTFRPGYHGGMWQMDEDLFNKTKDTDTYPPLADTHQKLALKLDVDWLKVQWQDLRKPLHGALAINIYMNACTEEPIPTSVKDQAKHWKKNYNRKDAGEEIFIDRVVDIEKQEIGKSQDAAMDLYFVLDSSASIGSAYYEKAKKFLAELASHFTIGKDKVRIGLVVYGSTPELAFDLLFNKDDVVDKIKSTEYMDSGYTATGDAISFMTETGFTAQHGTRPANDAVPHVALVLTDGASNRGMSVAEAAKSAREKSIEIHAYGIGSSVNDAELLIIAGSEGKVSKIDSFDNIDDAKTEISQGFYIVPVKVEIGTTYEGKVSKDESRFFKIPITRAGINIEIHVETGKLIMYGSQRFPNPNELSYDSISIVKRGPTEIVPINLRGHKDHEVFYSNFTGQEDCKFSMKVEIKTN